MWNRKRWGRALFTYRAGELAAGCAFTLLCACGGDSGPEPRLSAIKAEIFAPSCAFASCHGGDAPEQGLNLRTITHADLVSKPSKQAPGRVLVIPGDPDGSYLFEKLANKRPQVGNQMPPQSAGGALPDEKLAAVRQWIADMARDN